MSAISPQSVADSSPAGFSEAPVQSLAGASGASPPETALLAALANQLLAELAKEPRNGQSREDWLRRLDELETAILTGPANDDDLLKSFLTHLETELRLIHQASRLEAGVTGAGTRAEGASSEIGQPLPRRKETGDIGTTVQAASGPSDPKRRPETGVPDAPLARSGRTAAFADEFNFAAPIPNIEDSHRQLADRLESGLAAATAEMNSIKTAAIETERGDLVFRLEESFAELAKAVRGLSSELAASRSLSEDHWRQVLATLGSIQQSLERSERISDRSTPLGRAQSPLDPLPQPVNGIGPLATRTFPLEKQPDRLFERWATSSSSAYEAVQPRAGDAALPSEDQHTNIVSLLIEPGLGLPNRSETGSRPGEPKSPAKAASPHAQEEGSRTDFIAAARRAARAAQEELQEIAGQAGLDPEGAHPNQAHSSRASDGLAQKRSLMRAAGFLLFAASVGLVAFSFIHRHSDDGFFSGFKPAEAGKMHGKAAASELPSERSSASQVASQNPTPQSVPAVSKATQTGQSFDAALPAQGSSAAQIDPSSRVAIPFSQNALGRNASPASLSAGATKTIKGSSEIMTGALHPSDAKTHPPMEAVADPAAAPTDDLQLKALLEKADAGDAMAQFELALHYAEGKGTARSDPLAAHWYGKAAAQNLALAQYRLAVLYEKGLGVDRDEHEAKQLYQRAAEQGNIRAMHSLGLLAVENNEAKPNYTSAALWFGKAAEYGFRDSQYNLGVLLARGLGAPKDLVKSYIWFSIVAATGDADATMKRDEIAMRLTDAERARADAAAASFVPRSADREANETLASPPPSADPAKQQGQGLERTVSRF